MGRWVAAARRAYRDGVLDRLLLEQLEQLPGWTWDPLTPQDRAAVEALRSFAAWEKHVDVPLGHLEDGVELGHWVLAARRRQLLGVLPPAVRHEILDAAPLNRKGSTLWSWDQAGTQWRLAAAALAAYAR